MKTIEWAPIALHVAERADKTIALIVHDDPRAEMTSVLMQRGTAKAIGQALVDLADELDRRDGSETAARAPLVVLGDDGQVH